MFRPAATCRAAVRAVARSLSTSCRGSRPLVEAAEGRATHGEMATTIAATRTGGALSAAGRVAPSETSLGRWLRLSSLTHAAGARVSQCRGHASAASDASGTAATIAKGDEDGKLMIVYTCAVCNTRSMKVFSKHAYYKGVVIVRCDGCKSLHLVADNLHWTNADMEPTNIEDLMRRRGVTIPRLSGEQALEFVLKKADKDGEEPTVAALPPAAEPSTSR
eukprot:c4707_g1_i1.p1 GENE.c4707_g1_i1~~c4707_g1_i1.p1  ORF type:complete len:237 (+),score=23.10 c4707_g1_i1:54-713(+)